MSVGKRIRAARSAKGWSLDTLGKKVGVTRQAVWQWERGESDPIGHIEKLCRTFVLPYEYFYGEAPVANAPLESKLKRLLPHERAVIEAVVDGILAQRTDPKQAM